MKKKTIFTALVLVCLLCSAACSRREIRGEPQSVKDLNSRVLGVLVSPALVTPEDIQKNSGILPSEVRAFSTSTELLTALKTRRVDAMLTTTETSKFLMSADSNLRIIPVPESLPSKGLRMILRNTDTALLAELNSGIAVLRAEGALERLYAEYVTNVTVDHLAAAPAQLPLIEGAEKFLVGINGDLPPYDYITADGKPAGFNVALMSELSRVLGKNVEFVTVPSEARFSAMLSANSRRMDFFFWFYGNLTFNALVLTEAYAPVEECILARKE